MARARRARWAAALSFALCGCAATSPEGEPREGRVLRVVDGDTLKVRVAGGDVKTVRLLGIDTPESKRPGAPVECGSRRAGAALRRLVDGRSVVLVEDSSQDAVDRFGRVLAYVELGDDDVGEAMVASGWASPYVYGRVPFARVGAYRAASRAARGRGAGVFGTCGGDFHRAA